MITSHPVGQVCLQTCRQWRVRRRTCPTLLHGRLCRRVLGGIGGDSGDKSLFRASRAADLTLSGVEGSTFSCRLKRVVRRTVLSAVEGRVSTSSTAKTKPKNRFRPTVLRIDGHRCYRLFVAGYFWGFIVSGHSKQIRHREMLIGTTGELTVPFQKRSGIKFFGDMARDFRDKGLI